MKAARRAIVSIRWARLWGPGLPSWRGRPLCLLQDLEKSGAYRYILKEHTRTCTHTVRQNHAVGGGAREGGSPTAPACSASELGPLSAPCPHTAVSVIWVGSIFAFPKRCLLVELPAPSFSTGT